MVRVFRAQSYARSIVEPQPAARLLPRRNLQPFATPDTLDPVLANLPAISLQQRRDATVAIASVLSGKIGDGPGERVFIRQLRPQPLRLAQLLIQLRRRDQLRPAQPTPMLVQHPPRPVLRNRHEQRENEERQREIDRLLVEVPGLMNLVRRAAPTLARLHQLRPDPLRERQLPRSGASFQGRELLLADLRAHALDAKRRLQQAPPS